MNEYSPCMIQRVVLTEMEDSVYQALHETYSNRCLISQ